MTRRNRIALGFGLVALVMFVTWNLMPYHSMKGEPAEGIVLTEIWPRFFDLDHYVRVFRSPDVEGFVELVAVMALFLNALVVLALVPFWRILHASNYLTIPVAVVNFLGGSVILWLTYDMGVENAPRYSLLVMSLMAFTMYFLGLAMLIFKNELLLRHEREVGETLKSKL